MLNLLVGEEIDDVRLGDMRGFFDVHLACPLKRTSNEALVPQY